jgi:hypothetical protein
MDASPAVCAITGMETSARQTDNQKTMFASQAKRVNLRIFKSSFALFACVER